MMNLSSVFTRTLDAYQSGKYTIISNYGGTRSGKTYSTLQLLYLMLIGGQKDLLIGVQECSPFEEGMHQGLRADS